LILSRLHLVTLTSDYVTKSPTCENSSFHAPMTCTPLSSPLHLLTLCRYKNLILLFVFLFYCYHRHRHHQQQQITRLHDAACLTDGKL